MQFVINETSQIEEAVTEGKHQEHIVAIPADKISQPSADTHVIRGNISFKDLIIAQREMLEGNSNYRQIIPYLVVREKTAQGPRISVYRRTKQGGEGRLHDKSSIGYGGHMDLADVISNRASSIIDWRSTLYLALQRELNEELKIILPKADYEKGNWPTIEITDQLIIDETTPVNAVHLGLICFVDVPEGTVVESNEDQINIAGFFTLEEAKNEAKLEDWSKFVLSEADCS